MSALYYVNCIAFTTLYFLVYYIERVSSFCVGVHFKRNPLSVCLRSHLPAALIVISSFVGMCIHYKHVPARVMLSITCFLAIVALGLSRNPRAGADSATADDHYQIGCIVLIFGTLLEFALVHCRARRAGIIYTDGDEGRYHRTTFNPTYIDEFVVLKSNTPLSESHPAREENGDGQPQDSPTLPDTAIEVSASGPNTSSSVMNPQPNGDDQQQDLPSKSVSCKIPICISRKIHKISKCCSLDNMDKIWLICLFIPAFVIHNLVYWVRYAI